MAVAQLVEQLLPKTEICGSHPNIGNLEKPNSKNPIEEVELDATNEATSDVNGDTKNETPSKDKKGGNLPQRRMSLRPRAAPKKYTDAELSSDEEVKDPLATKDPLAIPILLGKNSSTVLIRKSPTAVTVKTNKPAMKVTKVTRPPPELIKAPISNKISISPATTVTVVPRSKENPSSNSGFVIVDTQSILTGKGPVAISSAPSSVTVSAVPSVPKPTPRPATAATIVGPKKPAVVHSNAVSLPDPFESLGNFFFGNYLVAEVDILAQHTVFFPVSPPFHLFQQVLNS